MRRVMTALERRRLRNQSRYEGTGSARDETVGVAETSWLHATREEAAWSSRFITQASATCRECVLTPFSFLHEINRRTVLSWRIATPAISRMWKIIPSNLALSSHFHSRIRQVVVIVREAAGTPLRPYQVHFMRPYNLIRVHVRTKGERHGGFYFLSVRTRDGCTFGHWVGRVQEERVSCRAVIRYVPARDSAARLVEHLSLKVRRAP